MMYSQKPLLSFFLDGKVPNESGMPIHIETVISNVFLFPERVYKIYKDDNTFFNQHFRDISDRATRFAFTKSDFEWNQQLSPELYLVLRAVKAGNNGVEYGDSPEQTEELVCITKRMPESTSFFSVLHRHELDTDDFASIGKQFGLRETQAVFQDAPIETFADNVMTRVHDAENWVSDGVLDEWVSSRELQQWLAYLRTTAAALVEDKTQTLDFCFDLHSLNAFYVEGTLIPFDTSPPKESWRFGPTAINAYRLATDIRVYAGEAAYQSFLSGYTSTSTRPPLKPDEERLWVVYASLIMIQYLFFLGKTDPDKLSASHAYLAFLRAFHPVTR
jgi:aminoglycoside phosphotransferase family enzyme